MSLSEWIGRRVHNWTTKPFPEGIPTAPAKSVGSSLASKAGAAASSPSPKNNSTSLSASAQPSVVSETPKESPEEIAEKIMILIPYIKQYRSQGMLDDEIESFLKEHAWPDYIVKKALQKA